MKNSYQFFKKWKIENIKINTSFFKICGNSEKSTKFRKYGLP